MLPDDILIAIFLAILDEYRDKIEETEMVASMKAWQTLVHVCRRWRSVVFGSPRHLNLRLVCTHRTSASDTLVVWPALPLVVCALSSLGRRIERVDNIVALLERSNRVHHIDLSSHAMISNLPLETVLAAMQVPFPELTHLTIWSTTFHGTVPVLPDSFLGGSALHLRYLALSNISFSGLPKLLLSATHIVHLSLYCIPHISPEAMATTLSILTSLDTLRLHFDSQNFPDIASRRSPPPTCFILPTLILFAFNGVSEYFEDLIAHIEAPRLFSLDIMFFNQTLFSSPQLVRFISRTPRLKAPEEVYLTFGLFAGVRLESIPSPTSTLNVKISCSGLDQLSYLKQICTSCSLSPGLSVENLYIYGTSFWEADRPDNVENSLWLELLQRFAAKNLYLGEKFAERIGPALQELVEGGMSEALPTLRNIFLEGIRPESSVQEAIQQFVATRQASYPIAVSRWVRDTRMFWQEDD